MKEFRQVFIGNVPTKYYVARDGEVISKYKNRVTQLKVYTTKKGYKYVKLWINNKSKAEFIHRLVAKTYIPNPSNKPEVNHKDGIKSHNYEINLEWVTSKENKVHAKKRGLTNFLCGEKMGRAIYTNEQIKKVCRLLEKNKHTVSEISKETGVSTDTIYGIRTKGLWSCISKDYKIPKVQKKERKNGHKESDIIEVCKLLQKGKLTLKQIEEVTGVNRSTVADILYGRIWKDISKKYDFSKFYNKNK